MNNKTNTSLIKGDSIESLRSLITQAAENIQAAADMLCRLCAADPDTVEKLTSGPDGLPEGFVNGLLRVGEKSLHPQLLLNRCPAYRKLAGMSYSVQEAVISKGTVELVVNPDTGDCVMVDLVKLEGEQLSQVISQAGVRSRDDQRAWLKRRTIVSPIPKDVGPPYEIKRDRLRILRGNVEFSRVELLRVLEQMVA
jgi:hypothetical protein